jgi:RimJ/RimL family protein N-acetyltransferase
MVTCAIVRRADNLLIGAIGLRLDQSHARAELGYWLGKPFWQRGYCTEAARAVVAYGFNVLGLHRIHAAYMQRNPASGRVMQKIGMTYEGCMRQHIRKWGVFEDLEVYGMLHSDYVLRQQRTEPHAG